MLLPVIVERLGIDHQRAHHVVLFVLEDVAVPHVLDCRPVPAGSAGTVKGTAGRSNFMSTRVTCPGFIRTVSFQPSSLASGAMAAL